MPVVPGGFDKQTPHAPVARPGDAPSPLPASARTLAGHQAEIRHQLAGRGEALEVVYLRHDRERAQRVETSEATQPAHRLPIGHPLRDRLELRIQRLEPALELLEPEQMIVQDRLVGRVLEPPTPQPLEMGPGPGLAPQPRRSRNFPSRCRTRV
jgi:hypothetical protein